MSVFGCLCENWLAEGALYLHAFEKGYATGLACVWLCFQRMNALGLIVFAGYHFLGNMLEVEKGRNPYRIMGSSHGGDLLRIPRYCEIEGSGWLDCPFL